MKNASERNRILFLGILIFFYFLISTALESVLFHNVYTNQILRLLGSLSEVSELPKQQVDVLLSGELTEMDYIRGLKVLEDSGYKQSGQMLLDVRYDIISLTCNAATALLFAALLFVIGVQYQKRQHFWKMLVELLRNPDNQAVETAVRKGTTKENREFVCVLLERRRDWMREKECVEEERARTIAFVEDISHQLKTPLTSLRIHIERIDYKKAYLQESVTKILEQTTKMTDLISDMMQIGMLNAGKSQLEVKKHQIADLAAEIEHETESLCEEKHVTLNTTFSGWETFCYDHYWIKEALKNVVKNCIEYSKPEKAVDLVYQAGESGMLITVRDYGEGIQKEHPEEIFERFTSSFRKNSNSSGLGLAVTKQIMEAHFGKVTVQNNQDCGVTFSMYIPLLRGKELYRITKEEERTEDENPTGR